MEKDRTQARRAKNTQEGQQDMELVHSPLGVVSLFIGGMP
jgi:hypothetical protein